MTSSAMVELLSKSEDMSEKTQSMLETAWGESTAAVIGGVFAEDGGGTLMDDFIDGDPDVQTFRRVLADAGSHDDHLNDFALTVQWRAYVFGVAVGLRMAQLADEARR